ncbi:hypothetical protein RFN28_27015 [Mesorhizobium sp. VK24D]|uniref:Uncharacterized protein n=1 Tax=Mesorhizobium album TaxID=3072314 RepID=A0ABU4Y564_9HYPH|nr:hypothetical protein [Mesorhizobium sp. VK24D]MDX8482084.1 hypothetical protein [Mesorhizobium sp. VK24D]
MRTFSPLARMLAAMAIVATTAASAQSMSPRFKEPQAVPLDFLKWIGKSTDWLEQEIAALGGAGKPTIHGDILETDDLGTLKAANRVRAFAFLAAKGLRPPYFDLAVAAADQTIRCVTQYPESIAPDIGAMDFAKKSFPAAAADQAELKSCTVAGTGGDFAGLDRATYRDRYFNASGTLKPEFRDLGDDPAFKAKAIDEGFFLTTEDYSGLLQLDLH